MMDTLGFTVHVAKAKDKTSPLGGQTSPPLFGVVVLGRRHDCDMVLGDRSVSGRHIKLERTTTGFALTNLSRHGATYVDRQKLAPEDTLSIEHDTFWLQIGRLLLKIVAAPDTLPVSDCLSLPGTEIPDALQKPPNSATPLLAVRAGPLLEVWLEGQPVALYPSAARLLLRLCQTPNVAVTYDELARAVDPNDHLRSGGINIAQLVTYTRNMFDQALHGGQLQRHTLNAAIEGGDALDTRSLLRKLVENIRGLGYRLNLKADRIKVLDPEDPPPRATGEPQT